MMSFVGFDFDLIIFSEQFRVVLKLNCFQSSFLLKGNRFPRCSLLSFGSNFIAREVYCGQKLSFPQAAV